MTARPQFVDLSVFNAAPDAIDWQKYKQWSASADGISRLCLRSSYGTGNSLAAIRALPSVHLETARRRMSLFGVTDAHFRAYRAGALAAGIDQLILYQYAYPQLNSPQAEAAHQASVLGPIRANDIIMLDIEENVPQATADWCYQWLTAQHKNYPNNPILLYSFPAFIAQHLQDQRLAAFPLILANWQYSPDETPACPPPWTSYAFLQYTDKAQNIPGIPGIMDADVYVGGITTDMPEKPIDISEVSQWFIQLSPTTWQVKDGSGKGAVDAKNQPLVVRDGMLTYLRSGRSSDALLGNFSRYGLPKENERSPMSGVAEQRCERAIIRWEPAHTLDNPPGVGACYAAHLETYYTAADSLGPVRDQLNATTTQLSQCQNTLKVTGQQLAQAQTALAASTGGDYGKAINDIADRIKGLPRYPTTIPQGGSVHES